MLLSQPVLAKGSVSTDGLNSCREVALSFYDWYVQLAHNEHPHQAHNAEWLALHRRGWVFSPELYAALKEDEDAQARSTRIDGVAGDFDPFLATNGPIPERIVVDVRSASAGRCLAPVYDVASGKRSVKPRVTPELALRQSHWVFVNFNYGDNDLVTILKWWRQERAKQPTPQT